MFVVVEFNSKYFRVLKFSLQTSDFFMDTCSLAIFFIRLPGKVFEKNYWFENVLFLLGQNPFNSCNITVIAML